MTPATLCPRFHRAIELIGGRWTGPILQILLAGPARFAQLRDAIPQISDRMLSERLHELEAEGIVTRAVIPASPVRVEYALSEKGRQLQAPLEAVGRWAERWIAVPAAGAGTNKRARLRATSGRASAPHAGTAGRH
jgi:DNA-binding HxlR family transcriptional regulator